MSKETPKITTILKEKDRNRVEPGKRLAQLNKERKLHKEQQVEIDDNSRTVNYSLFLNVIGVTAAVVRLYYVRKEFNSSFASSVVKNNKTPQVESKDPESLQVKPLLDTLQ